MLSGPLAVIQAAFAQCDQTLGRLHAQGRQIIGYFCTYTPIELLTACGYIPVRIMGGRGTVARAYNYLPKFICPFMKRSLEKALDGRYAYLSGVAQSYSCDAVCGSQAVWKNNSPGMRFFSMSPPYNDTDDARKFYIAEFKRLMESLGKAYDRAMKSALADAMALYADIRRKMSTLYSAYQTGRIDLSAQDMWYVIQTHFVLPPNDYLKLLSDLLEEVKEAPVQKEKSIPVAVSGSAIEHPDILTYIEALGGRIVWDDHCTGLRSFEPVKGAGADPLDQLADRYMKRAACASRCRAEERWVQWEERLNQCNAEGVILVVQKFCTPHLADYPYLKNRLRGKNIPVHIVEMDERWEVGGQIKTRLEGFMDMIRARHA